MWHLHTPLYGKFTYKDKIQASGHGLNPKFFWCFLGQRKGVRIYSSPSYMGPTIRKI